MAVPASIHPSAASNNRNRQNNIGVIRLCLASLVIYWHVTMASVAGVAIGPTAVCAFFMVSGWLITQSWSRSATPGAYLTKRVLRIYPAFIIAWLMSVLAADTTHGCGFRGDRAHHSEEFPPGIPS